MIRKKQKKIQAQINVTPFVDVMLVLLIVFMICAPMMHYGVDVSLPKTQSGKMRNQTESLSISVNKKGELFLEKVKISHKSLSKKLKALHAKNPSIACSLYADSSLSYQTILETLTIINTAGVSSVSLVSESKAKQ
ncbi:MAG: biopolymer transporter ExbD [Alphaproteobacteria bacterium]|nr:biopolymer transporter ExbD [Alphaproteobacteria bacterium]